MGDDSGNSRPPVKSTRGIGQRLGTVATRILAKSRKSLRRTSGATLWDHFKSMTYGCFSLAPGLLLGKRALLAQSKRWREYEASDNCVVYYDVGFGGDFRPSRHDVN